MFWEGKDLGSSALWASLRYGFSSCSYIIIVITHPHCFWIYFDDKPSLYIHLHFKIYSPDCVSAAFSLAAALCSLYDYDDAVTIFMLSAWEELRSRRWLIDMTYLCATFMNTFRYPRERRDDNYYLTIQVKQATSSHTCRCLRRNKLSYRGLRQR